MNLGRRKVRRRAGPPSGKNRLLRQESERRWRFLAGGAALVGLLCGAAPSSSDQIQREIQTLVAGDGSTSISLGTDRVHAFHALARFYERRDYRAAWSRDLQDELLDEIRGVDGDGLDPQGYHLSPIEEGIARNGGSRKPDARQAAELDILLTDAFLLLGSHLLAGRTNPVTIDAEWFADRREGDMVPVLEDALDRGAVSPALKGLKPVDAGYARLRFHLARLRAVAAEGGWPLVGPGESMKPGDVDPRIPEVRRRLAGGSPDSAPDAQSAIYDPDLAEAVRMFQERHGLNPDAVIGPRTLAAFNIPVEDRIDCLLVNLERWRWLPRDLGVRHILVNIAGFTLSVVEDHRPVLTMKVVVGRTYRRTPVFTGNLSRIVYSPAWDVPRKLAVQDKLPLIRKDPGYFDREGIEVFTGSGSDIRQVDPGSVDWSQVKARDFPYRLRQKPGPRNALGGVKFMFPNPFSVYLHDTSQPELFGETDRAFSSGCIRLEKPADLAAYLLRGRPEWNREAIDAAMKSGRERTVNLDASVPVHILYWTAWEDAEGQLQFRPDIYDRDRPLLVALRQDPPNPDGTDESQPVAQDPGPDVYPPPNAISAFVRRIFEDTKGNLWFGTNGDGVCRFDGRSPTYYSIAEGFGGVAVRGILEDKDGNVWFATSGGVTKYDGESFVNFTVADGLNHDDAWSIFLDRSGTLWIGTYGGACRFDGERFIPFPLPPSGIDPMRGVSSPEMVRSIMQDSAGNMWFGKGGGAYKYDGKTLTSFSETDGLCNNSVNDILEDQDGNIWFATHYKGVCRFDGESFTNVSEQEGLSGTEVWDLYEDGAGNIWFPSEGAGLYRYDGDVYTRFHEDRGLDSGAIQCTFQDREGRLWAGGYLGLYRLEGESFVQVLKNGPW